jgi:FkbM family methyltransferase
MIKAAISDVVARLAPIYWQRRAWKRHFADLRGSFHEPELHVAPFLCDRKKTSIDIGASEGIYTAHIIDASRDCWAFEPRPPQALRLREMVRCLSLPVRVEAVALSDTGGEAKLRVLERDEGRSTIERDNPLEASERTVRHEITVPTQRLDDYELGAVGFLKIDVEGHELAVLRGGLATIRRCLPTILIEIEERHKPNSVYKVSNMLEILGYEGYFILGRKLVSIDQFDVTRHQDTRNIGDWESNWKRYGVYINNFFFAHGKSRYLLEAAVANIEAKLSDI